MSKTSVFLQKKFIIISVLCCGICGSVFAADANTITVEICPENTYVQKCGDYSVGYRWIRYYKEDNDDCTTLKKPSDPAKRFEQMRSFFGDNPEPMDDINGNITDTSVIKACKNGVLQRFCNPDKKVSFTCAPCPNNAYVDASSVEMSFNNSVYVINTDTWKFNTIANCYLKQFEDDTGFFQYIESSEDAPEKCYYGSNVSLSDFEKNFNGTDLNTVPISNAENY